MPPDVRDTLLNQLSVYEKRFPNEKETIDRLRTFVKEHRDCFERTLLKGHVTGSALITDKTRSKVLLTHHAKLNKWLQLGGHSDGHPLVHETALREAEEESGLKQLRLTSAEIFDIDIHEIPERKTEPSHSHYDVRFLIEASDTQFTVTEESHDLRWFTLPEAFAATSEQSMHRQFEKLHSRQ